MPVNESPHYTRAALYSLLAYFIMALGIVAWKGVISSYSIAQILALEALFCLPLFIGLAKIKGGVHLLKTSYPVLQTIRGILQTVAAYLGLYGLLYLPVSTHTMLGYCTPFILTIAAWVFLKEKCPPVGWLCVLIGFIGAALIIQPEYTENFFAALAVIVSCCFWAGNVILMRQMPKDHVISFPFYTLLVVGSVSCLIVLIQGIAPMSLFDFSIVTIAGLFFFIGAQILFATYRMSPLHFLSPFQYSQIFWIALLSYFLWQNIPSVSQVIGLFLIAMAATYSSFSKIEVSK